jgi:hypothetical protein
MEKNRPFEAAIEILRLEKKQYGYRPFSKSAQLGIREMDAAIRVLEAAGKLSIYCDDGRPFICYRDKEWSELAQALLAALPDKEPK